MTPSLSQDLKTAMADLPFVSSDLPGIGGVIKAVPEHFKVEETLPYEPCGEGEHVFVKLRRQGWNTMDVAHALGEAFGIGGADIGWGGRKDKNAVTTQTFSLHLPMTMGISDVAAGLKTLPFEILELKRHGNKLKTGHVAANRFSIILTETDPQAWTKAAAIEDRLRQTGLPNFYGEQRFGHELRNIDRAAGVMTRGKARGRQEGFWVSVMQSALFNIWLKERMARAAFNTIIPGDLAKKTDTGGMFVVDDLDEAMQRFATRQIVYTGPIFGHKMRPAGGQAEEYERRILKRFGFSPDMFKPLRAAGSRRSAIIYLDDLTIDRVPEGLRFTFSLPSGAYATNVLREFTRTVTDQTV